MTIVIVGGHNPLAREGLWGHARVLLGYDPAHRFDEDTVGSAYAFVNPGEHSPDTWWQQRDNFLRDWGGMWSLVVTLGG